MFGFQFNGCCRGGAANRSRLMGHNFDFYTCAKSCVDDVLCNAIEVNGWEERPQWKGQCTKFYGTGAQLTNGMCNGNGTQKCYRKLKAATYNDLGAGRCLQKGRVPKHLWMAGKTNEECKFLCDGEQECSGYSWNRMKDCFLWLPTLTGGGPTWGGGGGNCVVKRGERYENLGSGRCLDNGDDWIAAIFKELSTDKIKSDKDCKDTCSLFSECAGYSYNDKIDQNCILWSQPTLTNGGTESDGARCFVKGG